MDHAMLRVISGELRVALLNQPLAQVAQLDSHRFLLRFEDPPFPRLHIAIHPRLSTIHLARGVKTPTDPTDLGASLTRQLEGRRVTDLTKPPGERLVRIRFGDDRILVIELMGRASNLLLLDVEERVLLFARSHAGTFRQPVEGGVYQPPPPLAERARGTFETLTADQLRAILDGAADDEGDDEAVAGDDRTVAKAMCEEIAGLSAHLAREVIWQARRGADAWETFDAIRARVLSGPHQPVLHAPEDAERIVEATPLGARNLFAFLFPLPSALTELKAIEFPTAGEAEAAATDLTLRHLAYASVKESLAGVLRQERKRADALLETLEKELEEAARTQERNRRYGELILAGLSDAQRQGSEVLVIDHYDPEQRRVPIPIDPCLNLNENAAKLFKTARRAERTAKALPGRLATLRQRREAIADGERGVDAALTLDALKAVESELQETGIIRAYRRVQRADVAVKSEYVPVREFRTADGFTVIVGRSSADNEHVTFRVAAPHDLWLHASGWPGAHVVVRNPQRRPALPEGTVHEAAGIAAWFSKGRDEKHVEVHVAWRRHVRKGKGMPSGMVMLKKFRSVRVSPRLPEGTDPLR